MCTRDWKVIPARSGLFELVGSRCLTYRMYLPVSSVLADIRNQVCKKLRSCGMIKDETNTVSDRYYSAALSALLGMRTPFLHLDNVKAALRPVYRADMMFVRIERNPGRAILMCKALWARLQWQIFVSVVYLFHCVQLLKCVDLWAEFRV